MPQAFRRAHRGCFLGSNLTTPSLNNPFQVNTPLLPRHSSATWWLVALCLVALLPFLGLTLFNTRGEPREAVVALSMLKEGNWILPVNNGVDLAYKPPFFHWLIALFSLPTGHVTEYTSRLPSALALMAMTVAGFRFYERRRGLEVAGVMALVTLSCFEVHRAGVACRVDMVLTCMMVLSLYALYRWVESGMKGLPFWGILCLSGAFLTKGPVGAALPCLVVAVFAWVRGRGFWSVLWRMACVGLLSCVLPALWYAAAYRQGGERFFQLVYEENVLRLTGRMTYESHVNPWTYNVVTVVAGLVPYTLLLLLSLFAVNFKCLRHKFACPAQWWGRFTDSISRMDDARLFSLLSIVIIFVFYCIPKSKRSVYLLPIYPFLAYFIAELIISLRHKHRALLQAFGWIVALLSTLVLLAFIAVRVGIVPEMLVNTGRHAVQNTAMLRALRDVPLAPVQWVALAVQAAAVVAFFVWQRAKTAGCALGVVIALFFALDGVYQPLVLNTKSDLPVARQIARMQPQGTIYSFRTDVTPGNPFHPFTVNFYLGDRVTPFEAVMPTSGLLLTGNEEIEAFKQRYPAYDVQLAKDFHHQSCDDHKWLKLYRISLRQP